MQLGGAERCRGILCPFIYGVLTVRQIVLLLGWVKYFGNVFVDDV